MVYIQAARCLLIKLSKVSLLRQPQHFVVLRGHCTACLHVRQRDHLVLQQQQRDFQKVCSAHVNLCPDGAGIHNLQFSESVMLRQAIFAL